MSNEKIYTTLRQAIISEKSSIVAAGSNQYVFQVATQASKDDIAKAVATIFDVNVLQVRTLNVQGKEKRFGRIMGRRKNWKKAYVRLAEGQTIDLGLGG